MSKKDDLEAHRSGTLRVKALIPSEEHIQIIEEVAIVSERMHLIGSYAGTGPDPDLRFTRIWAHSSADTWHVDAAHSSVVTQLH